MKKIKKIIIGLIILIVIIIISLIIINKINKKDEGEVFGEEQVNDSKITIESTDFDVVKYNSEYYGISNVIDNIIAYSNIIYNESYLSQNSSAKVDVEFSEEDKELYTDMILNMLSDKYKNKYNIDKNNLKKYVFELIGNKYKINNMYSSLRDNDVIIYLIYGNLQSTQKKYNFMVVVDSKENAYEVYLNNYINELEYNEEKINSLKIENDNIKLNSYNEFLTRDITNEEMAGKYLKNYKEILQKDLKEAYKMLDSEYRKKRFGSYAKFEEYYKLQIKEWTMASLQQYKVVSYDDYTDYICVDNYDNCYTFRTTAVMKYTVLLDEYTIETDEYKEKYESAKNTQKVYANVEKFIKMINTKDYESAYAVLDEDYRKNNFNTLDTFKNYIKSNFYTYNTIASSAQVEVSDDGNFYSCEVKLTDTTNSESEKIDVNFIVILGEGTDFTIGIMN